MKTDLFAGWKTHRPPAPSIRMSGDTSGCDGALEEKCRVTSPHEKRQLLPQAVSIELYLLLYCNRKWRWWTFTSVTTSYTLVRFRQPCKLATRFRAYDIIRLLVIAIAKMASCPTWRLSSASRSSLSRRNSSISSASITY